MNRRRSIRRRPSIYRGQKMQVNFLPVIVIICLSVCAGYLTAKYVIYPVLGYEPAGLSILKQKQTDIEKEETAGSKSGEPTESRKESLEETSKVSPQTPSDKVIEDKADVRPAAGYAIQFGSYSTREAAEKSAAQLKASGIEVETLEKDGAFKVIGQLFDTKDKAKAELSKIDTAEGAFVTTLET